MSFQICHYRPGCNRDLLILIENSRIGRNTGEEFLIPERNIAVAEHAEGEIFIFTNSLGKKEKGYCDDEN